jgi:aerobic carbon-monoxide dehydrogenase small subunit
LKQLLELIVNGQRYDVVASPRDLLIDVLRRRVGVTGPKKGCGEGQCGACTVLLDGEPVVSCLTLAVACSGRRITTVEGLTKEGRLSRLQEAFVEHGAIQCGFCTPGMLMSATALLDENPDPSEAEIRARLTGNLCRCTGYVKIVEAVQIAAQRIREDAAACRSATETGELT